MSEVFDFLNANSGALAAIFSGVVTVATVLYAMLTWRLVIETRRMRSAQTDARVAVGMQPKEDAINFVELVVRNEGMGPAYDVTFEVGNVGGRACNDTVLEAVRALGFVEVPVPYMAAGAEFRTFLTSMLEDLESKIESSFEITVSYKTAAGERRSERYVLDFSVFKGLKQLGHPPLSEMARAITKIQRDMGHFASGFSRLRVLTEDASERGAPREADALARENSRLTEEDIAELKAMVVEKGRRMGKRGGTSRSR